MDVTLALGKRSAFRGLVLARALSLVVEGCRRISRLSNNVHLRFAHASSNIAPPSLQPRFGLIHAEYELRDDANLYLSERPISIACGFDFELGRTDHARAAAGSGVRSYGEVERGADPVVRSGLPGPFQSNSGRCGSSCPK
ncbi:hypothetical protein BDV93DRAFT_566170 [Ceratobasidium sp. AG-I]|nr:hypothetical protein BDV93DRAFT_566170 [Ceratobasidium sp. AG-I]